MNVLNDQDVTAYCQRLSTRANHPGLSAWVSRNLRKHILRTPNLHKRIDASDVERMVVAGTLWETPTWLEEAFLRGDAVHFFEPDAIGDFTAGIATVIDHRNAEPVAQMERVSIPEAIEAAAMWERTESRRRVKEFAESYGVDERTAAAILARHDSRVAALWPEREEHVTSMHRGPDFDLVEIVHPKGLDREGMLMDHCVATYKESLAEGRIRILSVRDRQGVPHATLEVGENDRHRPASEAILWKFASEGFQVAHQIRGVSNKPIPLPVAKFLAQALATTPVKVVEHERLLAGLPWNLSVQSTIDLVAVAKALPGEARAEGPAARRRPSTALMTAIQAVRRLPAAAAALDMDAFLMELYPTLSDVVRQDEVLTPRPRTRAVSWKIPNVLLTGAFAEEVSARPEATRAFVEIGKQIISQIRKEPNDIHRVAPQIGVWRDPMLFFAWCGLAKDWQEANSEAAKARQAYLSSQRLAAKQRLRDPGVDDDERAELMNAINVQIPRLMSM